MKNHVMVDLETMSTKPNAAIVAIGATKFGKDGLVGEPFYRIVDLESSKAAGLVVDDGTAKWWSEQSAEARSIFTDPDARELKEALQDFTAWAGKAMLLWGNGSDFDNVILQSSYEAVKLPVPWRFWDNRCYRTMKAMYPGIALTREGVYHNAKDDAITQALHLVEIIGAMRG